MQDYPVLKIRVSEIELAPWNYKTEDETRAIKLQNAMEKSGYISKIAIAQRDEEPESEKYEVIDGNHRVMAFRNMGVEEIQATFVGRIRKTERQRKGIELNELRFQSDNIKLAENLSDILKDMPVEDLVLTMPYNQEEIENFGKLLTFDWNNLNQGHKETEGGSGSAWVKFSFGEYNKEVPASVYDQFKEAIGKLEAQGVTDLPHQIEYLMVSFLNSPEAQGNGEES